MIRRIYALILSFFFLSWSTGLLACDPPSPDKWFDERISINSSDLPEPVNVREFDYKEFNYAIYNPSAEPFYIVTHRGPYSQASTESELPSSLKPIYKLVNGKNYFWEENEGKWILNDGGINNHAATMVGVDGSLLGFYQFQSTNIYKDDRPKNPDIPEVQQTKIKAYYKGKIMEIPVIISYTLNQDYKPFQRQEGIDACNPMIDRLGG